MTQAARCRGVRFTARHRRNLRRWIEAASSSMHVTKGTALQLARKCAPTRRRQSMMTRASGSRRCTTGNFPPPVELTPSGIALVIAQRIARFHISLRTHRAAGFPRRQGARTRAAARGQCCACRTIAPAVRTILRRACRKGAVRWRGSAATTWRPLALSGDADFLHEVGGEGVAWVGQAPFTETKHVFANLGDGTYMHSGILAIRQALAGKSSDHLQDPLTTTPWR